MSADKLARQTWAMLQKLQERLALAPDGEKAHYELKQNLENDFPSVLEQIRILAHLNQRGAIKITSVDRMGLGFVIDLLPRTKNDKPTKGVLFEKISPAFDEVIEEYSQYASEKLYRVKLKDREIWVNDFLLSKPYAARKNMTLFEYMLENPNKRINLVDLPQRVRNDIGKSKLIKILNALGFKREIRKAFIRGGSKSGFIFRKEVSLKQLENEGINLTLFVRQLKDAHKKISPSSPK